MIKFAVVGYGHIGKRHAAMIQQNKESALVAICDLKPKEALDIDENSDLPFFQSIEEMLKSNLEIDVVCICTPNGFHASQSVLALEANKHVLCEKPMGLTKSSCEAIIHKALNASKHVFCVMQNRYSPPSKWIKEVIDQKLLGKIYLVQINCFWNRDERYYLPDGKSHIWRGKKEQDGGTLFTQFSHFIDLMYWLFGDIKNIKSEFFDFNHQNLTDFEDAGIINFEFVKEGKGTITYSTAVWDKNFESSVTIIGEKGTVKLGGQYMNKVDYCHIENYEMPTLEETGAANDYGGYKGSAANHHFVIENVIDVLKRRKIATTNAMEGMKVVDIIERIYLKTTNKKKLF